MTTSFADLGVPPQLVRSLAGAGVTEPFPIQVLTVADALAGRDLCARAPTGSGKTLAFALPLALRAGQARPGKVRALVLVPTRELAQQVADVLKPLVAATNRHVAAVYGGTSVSKDVARVRRGVDILVACPGRLADLVERRAVALGDVDLVVLDEADRMADMGFLPEVRRLLDATSSQRQTLLYSATLDGDIDVLVRRYQRDPVRHDLVLEAEDEGDVRHLFWGAEGPERIDVAREVCRAAGTAIVFTRTKHGADRVVKRLARDGHPAAALHSGRTQPQRERALADFSAGRVTTLVATDVAARGIHVDGVGAVVHFDPPATDKDYVHRSGRTGRAGADGLVVTLVPQDRMADVRAMQRDLSLPVGVGAVALDALAAGGTRRAPATHRDLPPARPEPVVREARRSPGDRPPGGRRRRGGRPTTSGSQR